MKPGNRSILIISIIVILGLVLGASSVPLASQTLTLARIQPALSALAQQDPGQTVQVIVQSDGSPAAQEVVRRLDGQVQFPLNMIRAFVARMKAGAALELSAHPSVRWVSLDAPVQESNCNGDCISAGNLTNAYIRAIKAEKVWGMNPMRQGKGIGVAVVDSGVNPQKDLYTPSGTNRIVTSVRFNSDYNQSVYDQYGHGNAIAGVIGGNGLSSNGKYIGVAPQSSIINVKVTNDDGSATTSSVVAGLEWIYNNARTYNIRVVNISFNSTVSNDYRSDPLNAAVEVLWFNKIVVVVSAGNNGSSALYPPANDPFVITVGAVDDKGTASLSDDVVASFSAYSSDNDPMKKPDLVAPGRNIISLIGNYNAVIAAGHPRNRIDETYFRMSGTSMSAPMVTGAVALLLEDEPNLTPDQVKYRLMNTANKSWAGYNASKAGAGYLDVHAAVTGTSTQSANTGILPSQLLSTGNQPINSSIGWNSIGWNSIGWNSIGWNSIGWNSIGWNSDYWE